MQSPALAVLLVLAAAAGAAVQIGWTSRGLEHGAVGWRTPTPSRWSFVLAATLVASIVAFSVPARLVEPALLARSAGIVAAGVMLPFVLARVGDVPFPRWARWLVLVLGGLRLALWPTTDLVYAHELDAVGNPVYGPLLAPISAPVFLVAVWIVGRVVRSAPTGTARRAMGLSTLVAVAVAGASVVVGAGPTAEALSALWIVPLLYGMDVLLREIAGEQATRLARFDADRVALTARMSEANEELGRTLRLREELLAVTSHELRTPLTPLRGALELLDRGDELGPDRRATALELATRNAERLELLVDGLLATSKARAGLVRVRLAPVGVTDIVAEAAATVHPLEVEVRIDPPGLGVHADAARSVEILASLLGNAAKYGAPPFRIEAMTDGAMVVLAVVDHGDGVPEGFVPRLFEPFTQASTGTTRTSSGVGVGLSLARTLAELQGGTLEHRSVDGSTRFVLALPQADADPAG